MNINWIIYVFFQTSMNVVDPMLAVAMPSALITPVIIRVLV
jgi:hypothetical protein